MLFMIAGSRVAVAVPVEADVGAAVLDHFMRSAPGRCAHGVAGRQCPPADSMRAARIAHYTAFAASRIRSRGVSVNTSPSGLPSPRIDRVLRCFSSHSMRHPSVSADRRRPMTCRLRAPVRCAGFLDNRLVSAIVGRASQWRQLQLGRRSRRARRRTSTTTFGRRRRRCLRCR